MSLDGPLNIGLQGIQRGMDNLRKDASDIASAKQFNGESDSDVTESLVNLTQDRLQVQTAAKVVKAVDETLGTLIDELA